jgi:hypothetical protein
MGEDWYNAQFGFQFTYLPAQWWLCHVEPFGCTGEMQFFCYGNEIA